MSNGNSANGGELRSVAEIQRDVDAMFANLGDAEYQITQQTERKAALLARMRELGAEMHMARKVAAAQARAVSSAPVAPPAAYEQTPFVQADSPTDARGQVVAKRTDDLKRAAETIANGPPLIREDAQPATEPVT